MDADGNRSNTQNDGEKQDGHKAARFFLGWLVALNKGITKLLKKALGPGLHRGDGGRSPRHGECAGADP